MTGPTGSATAAEERPPLWRDVRVLGWVFQLAVLAVVLVVLSILVNNVRVNSDNLGIPTDFGFVDQPASFSIPGNDFRSSQPVRDAIVEGALNTLRVTVVGIVAATVLGIAVGIGRLSGNWLLRATCRVFVEIIRNVPLLGLVIFFYLAVMLKVFPPIDEVWRLEPLWVISNRGTVVPWLAGSFLRIVGIFLFALVAAYTAARWRRRVAERTGQPAYDLLAAAVVFVVLALLGQALTGARVSTPALDGRQVGGGITMQPEYFALLVALVVYTASHIGEIVRGSIQAVPKGQFEAASSLALGSWDRMRYVILPQALRIAVPPIGNQYLNLMKNSSLGFAISYFELTKVTSTTIGNRSPAIPAYLVLMAVYLVFSLIISLLVNLANRRFQVAGR